MTNDFKVGDRVFVHGAFGAFEKRGTIANVVGEDATIKWDAGKVHGSQFKTLEYDYFHRIEGEPRFHKWKKKDLIAYIEKLEARDDQ